jgi:HemY protein
MRWALWLLGLFAVAVASAFLAGHNEGMATLFWPPYRVDMSLNLVLLVACLGFVFIYLALRALALLLDLPKQARRWRLLQKERAVHASTLESLAYLLTGRYVRARKSALQAIELERDLRENLRLGETLPRHLSPLRVIAHLMVAESAHALRDPSVRDQHLNLALVVDSPQGQWAEFKDAALLSSIRWRLADRDADQALRMLAELPHGLGRRTLALRLRLKASQLERNHLQALETARLLSKHGAFSENAASSLLRRLSLSSLASATDADALRQLWQTLQPVAEPDHEVNVTAARRWLDLGGDAAVALQWLTPQWEDWVQHPDAWPLPQRVNLIEVMDLAFQKGPTELSWLHRLEQAMQRWPQQAELQYLAGCLFLQHQLWGKAQLAFERSAPHLATAALRARAWSALAELAERRGDAQLAGQCWKKAALAQTPSSDVKG